MTAPDAHQAIDAIYRIESPRLIAGLTRIVRDVGLAEELAHDALVKALEEWPASGVPDNPGAWLMTTAKNRAIDRVRRRKLLDRKHEELGRDLDARQAAEAAAQEAALDDDIGDDLLRLIFTACHPVLTEARGALTLRLLGADDRERPRVPGTRSDPSPTRIVRETSARRGARPFGTPQAELAARLSSVLESYLIFSEGYAATGGDDWCVPPCEALRLGRILVGSPGPAGAHSPSR